MIFATLLGADLAQTKLRRMADSIKEAGRWRVTVGSYLPYARGIETGRTIGGRVARKAGGLYYLAGALSDVQPDIRRGVAQAIGQNPRAVQSAFGALAMKLERRAVVRETAVVKGNLRRSLHGIVARR